jgi:hypothetical protein
MSQVSEPRSFEDHEPRRGRDAPPSAKARGQDMADETDDPILEEFALAAREQSGVSQR